MSSQGLAKQIQREVKAHPVKAGVLGLALLVALWFWAPLVIGWLPGADKSGSKAPAVAAAPAASNTKGGKESSAKSNWNPNWTDMVASVQSNDLMRPAASLEKSRDPFRPLAPPPSAVTAKAAPPPKIDPQSLGLQLGGTLIGARESVATINGKVYVLPHTAAGKGVDVAIRQQDQEHHFILRLIEPDQVHMEFQGQPFQLRVKEVRVQRQTIELDEKSTIEFHGAFHIQ